MVAMLIDRVGVWEFVSSDKDWYNGDISVMIP